MTITPTSIPDVLIVEPKVFGDERGYFFESFSARDFAAQTGINTPFVQDNESCSRYGVLRGLHFQKPPYTQAKLVRVAVGKIIDVAVDIRRSSPTFGKYVAVELSSANHRQLYIPRGFAHGFVTLSEQVILQYKCDAYYEPSADAGIAWDDPTIGIAWPIPASDIILSSKDSQHPSLQDAFLFD